jgi:hypothetical protein
MTIEPNFKVTIQAANRASPHNHFHIFSELSNGTRSYQASYMLLRKAQEAAVSLINSVIYDRKSKIVAGLVGASSEDVSEINSQPKI